MNFSSQLRYNRTVLFIPIYRFFFCFNLIWIQVILSCQGCSKFCLDFLAYSIRNKADVVIFYVLVCFAGGDSAEVWRCLPLRSTSESRKSSSTVETRFATQLDYKFRQFAHRYTDSSIVYGFYVFIWLLHSIRGTLSR